MLEGIKQRAARSHAAAIQAVQEQKELQTVGATLVRAFSAPVQLAERPPVENAATLRPTDGLREIYAEGHSELSTDLVVIVTDAAQGDRVAVSRLLEHLRPLVVRYCRARIGRRDRSFISADDVAQEVCLAVLRALPTYRDQGRPFLAFVYGIAAHKVATAHQTALRKGIDTAPELSSVPPTEMEEPQRAAQVEMSERMAQLLKLLPDKQREILVLRVVVGLSAEETADVVGSTPNAVRVAQHQALAQLRKTLSQQ
nr:RNA polymerase sigma factor ShbA [Saccharothrix deserti]